MRSTVESQLCSASRMQNTALRHDGTLCATDPEFVDRQEFLRHRPACQRRADPSQSSAVFATRSFFFSFGSMLEAWSRRAKADSAARWRSNYTNTARVCVRAGDRIGLSLLTEKVS